MSGILDRKTRVVDTTLTLEGRRQLAEGGLRISAYSFSDEGTFYAEDEDDGVQDATLRVTLEASNLPQDLISLESNVTGRVMPFVSDCGIQIADGQIVSLDSGTIVSGSQFTVSSSLVLSSAADNLRKLMLLSTVDEIFDDSTFDAGNKQVEFVVTDKKPIKNSQNFSSNVNTEETVFNDARFSNVLNFKHLPPINKLSKDDNVLDPSTLKRAKLGNFPPMGGSQKKITAQTLLNELNLVEKQGYAKSIRFEPSSKANNFLVQVFEKKHDQLNKLDIVHYGSTANVDIFFLGKILTNDKNQTIFMHLFTITFQA